MSAFVVVCILAVATSLVADYTFDSATALTSLWLADFAYCPSKYYLTHDFSTGYSAGFVATVKFSGPFDTSGFVGYRSSDKHIYISFEGSESIENWITDARAAMTYYNRVICRGCMVHEGFLNAYANVRDPILAEVKRLHQIYSDYTIVVTGHSLGGALATLAIADIVILTGISSSQVKLVTFGSPRVFNKAGAEFVTGLLADPFDRGTIYRITHYKDFAVHLPKLDLVYPEKYVHVSGEWYEYPGKNGNVIEACTQLFETHNCSDQWNSWSAKDHHYYLGFPMGKEGCDYVRQN